MKRRFDFRLRRLLHVREIEEHVARAEWAAREGDAERAEEARAATSREIAEARAYLVRRGEEAPNTPPAWFTAAHRVIDAKFGVLRARREQALTRRGQAEAAKAAWREREARRRGLEELESRARLRHRIELERRDNEQMDEIASARAAAPGRKRRETDYRRRENTADECT